MYILYNKNTLKVFGQPLKKEPISYSNSLLLAEFYGELPTKYDYLTVANVQEKTDTWVEKEQVEKENKQGEIVIEEIEAPKSRTYFVCDLVANFRPLPTAEQLDKQRQAKYESLCQKYIREKYSATDENKVVREYLADMNNNGKKTQFDTYNFYVESCKAKARVEVYGV